MSPAEAGAWVLYGAIVALSLLSAVLIGLNNKRPRDEGEESSRSTERE